MMVWWRTVLKTAVLVWKCPWRRSCSICRNSACRWQISEVVLGSGLHRLDVVACRTSNGQPSVAFYGPTLRNCLPPAHPEQPRVKKWCTNSTNLLISRCLLSLGVYWILRRERCRAEKTIRREADSEEMPASR